MRVTIMTIVCWVLLVFAVLLLAWRSNCTSFFMAHIVYDADHKNIILGSDYMMTLDLIMSNVQPHHPHAPLIRQIVQLQH